jgi:Na+/H+-translocating membrane pyrophosphatase
VLIPEFTKVFTSSHSKHVHEIVTASREGGSSLTILSGIVAGNFSAFWKGLLIAGLMGAAFFVSGMKGGINEVMEVQLVKAKSPALDKIEPPGAMMPDGNTKKPTPIRNELEAILTHKSPTLEAAVAKAAKADQKVKEAVEKELEESKGKESATRDALVKKLDAAEQNAIKNELQAIEKYAELQKSEETKGKLSVASPTLATLDPVTKATIEAEVNSTSNLVGVGSIFAFGLVAFGFLCMGPVNIAVDSYGPVTDNAQSIFELAQTESIPGIKEEIKKDFGFEPDFHGGKHYLEANDSAGNTFKATAKPVLIGTAVVGATTMIFAIILLLGKADMLHLSLTDAPVLLGFICGGAVIYWFCGASMQAVTTGAYRAVEFIKKNMDLTKKEADLNDSKTVVRICTEYAQAGMWNIFIALMSFTLAFALFDPNFFVAYLVSIAVFGLFQAIYMANAGGSWDNAKKYVEVDLKEKNTPLHEATVVGDTVGDPFKDTSSVALNPIIKFSTLFGLLAVEIVIEMKLHVREALAQGHAATDYTPFVGAALLLVALVFVWRSFYAMRIPPREGAAAPKAH